MDSRLDINRPRSALLLLLLLGALVLLPFLGRIGLWDPQEVRFVEIAHDVAAAPWLTVPQAHARPPLPVQVLAAGLKYLGTSELGGRLPVAVAGLLTLLCLFGAGLVLYGPRAAFLATMVLLSAPTFFLGARQMTVHLLPVLGQTLAVLGLCAFLWPRRSEDARRFLGLPAALLGLAVGFFSTGAALGVSAPLWTIAIAMAAALGFEGRGNTAEPDKGPMVALLSALGALGLLFPLRLLAAQLQSLYPAQEPKLFSVLMTPERTRLLAAGLLALGGALLLWRGRRSRTGLLLGPALLTLGLGLGLLWPLGSHTGGYSPAVGGYLHWPPGRDIQIDTVLKPLGFQLFPWSALLPLALAGLLSSAEDLDARGWFARLVPLAWFATSYVLATYQDALSSEVPFPALCALALAAGLYLDRLLADPDDGVGGKAAGLCVAMLCVLVGRDLFLFPEYYGGAHYSDALHWPAPLTQVPPLLVLYAALFGALLGLAIAVTGTLRRLLLYGSLGLGLGGALVTIHGLVPAISQHVSHRGIFTRYKSLGGGDLGLYSVPRSGARFYDQNSVDLHSVQEVFDFLRKPRPKRAFVMIGASELAAVDQLARQKGYPYVVVDDSNVQFLLLSDRLGPGEKDLNPLRRLVLDKEPTPRFRVHANFENKIELLGYDAPDEVSRGDDFVIRLYYKVRQPLPGGYKIFLHLDGASRWLGDHVPLDGKFPTTYWVPGYYIIDEHHMSASRINQTAGTYQMLTGFWPGGNGERLKVVEGPQDGDHRVRLGSLRVK